MSWIEEEEYHRAKLEKRRQAEAQKAAEKLAKESNERQRKMVDQFANDVKKALPRGVSIVGKYPNVRIPDWVVPTLSFNYGDSYEQSYPGFLLKIHAGHGLKVDFLRTTWSIRHKMDRGSDYTQHDEIMVFESGGDYSPDRLLARMFGVPSKEWTRSVLYDAYRRLAAPDKGMEARQ
jgi:hypothetical protein